MRNDRFNEFDDVPSITTDSSDREGRPGLARKPVAPVKSATTGWLWTLLAAFGMGLAGQSWWSHQQLLLMEQQLIATQESFARINEAAAGRLDDIRGKFVAKESNLSSDREALKRQVKELQSKLLEQSKAQQGSRVALDDVQEKLKAQLSSSQQTTAQSIEQIQAQLKGLSDQQGKLKDLSTQLASANEKIKQLSAELAALKQTDQSKAVKGLQDDLLVLRAQWDNRQGKEATSTQEFDAFRAQIMRNITALQTQVQQLQQGAVR